MANKYKVEQNGQFLGHHSGHTPADAVVKAINKNSQYYNINTNDWFDTYRGSDHQRVYVGEE